MWKCGWAVYVVDIVGRWGFLCCGGNVESALFFGVGNEKRCVLWISGRVVHRYSSLLQQVHALAQALNGGGKGWIFINKILDFSGGMNNS